MRSAYDGAVFQSGAVRRKHTETTVKGPGSHRHGRRHRPGGGGVGSQITVPKCRSSQGTSFVVVGCRESPIGLGRADVSGKHNVWIDHQVQCWVVFAHLKRHRGAVQEVAHLDFLQATFFHLVGKGNPPSRFSRLPKLASQTPIGQQRERCPFVPYDHFRRICTGMHDPVFLPARPWKLGLVPAGAWTHPQVDSWPNIVEFEAGLRHQTLGPARRVLAQINVDAVASFRKHLALEVGPTALPMHLPSMACQKCLWVEGRQAIVLVGPQFVVPFAGHPDVHAVLFQPSHSPCPVRTRKGRHLPLALVGKPLQFP